MCLYYTYVFSIIWCRCSRYYCNLIYLNEWYVWWIGNSRLIWLNWMDSTPELLFEKHSIISHFRKIYDWLYLANMNNNRTFDCWSTKFAKYISVVVDATESIKQYAFIILQPIYSFVYYSFSLCFYIRGATLQLIAGICVA